MDLPSLNTLLLLISTILGLYAYTRYGVAVYHGRFIPNILSRISWGLLACIGAYLQFINGAGFAVVATGLMAAGSFALATIAYVKHNQIFDPLDLGLFFVTITLVFGIFLPIPNTYITVLMTITSILAFGPTIHSIVKNPKNESAEVFLLSGLKFLLVLPLVGILNINTLLYPLSLIFMNGLAYLLISQRKTK